MKAYEIGYVDVDDSTFGSEPAQFRSYDRQIRDGSGKHMDDRLDAVRACVSGGDFRSPVAADALLFDATGALRQNSCLHRPVHLRTKPPENSQ